MPKQVMQEPRFDFRGGRNTNVSPDLLNATELVDCTNARIGHDTLGAITKRTGTRRLHQTALANAPVYVYQWDAPTGKEVVAWSGGDFFYRAAAGADYGAFTKVAVGATPAVIHYSTFRAATSGAPLILFMYGGGHAYKWDGTTLTDITGVGGVPAASLGTSYHTREFVVDDTNYPKHIWWSKVGDGETFTTGLSTDGGSAMVDVLSGDAILAIETIGNSLLIATRESIARFTGYSANDIQIAQDTGGLSADVGVVGQQAFLRVEQIVALYSDRGAYIASEAGVNSIGFDVEPDFDNADRTYIGNVVIGHNRQRREIWYAIPYVGDSGLNKHVLVYNYRIQNWYGPFTYSFGITSMYRYTDASGQEWFMAGCADGFIRHLDIGTKDDVLYDASGGSIVAMFVELAPFIFADGPGTQKALRRLYVQANLPSTSALQVKFILDLGTGTSFLPATLVGLGATTQSYRVDAPSGTNLGRRARIEFFDSSADIPIINGIMLEAFDMLRPLTN